MRLRHSFKASLLKHATRSLLFNMESGSFYGGDGTSLAFGLTDSHLPRRRVGDTTGSTRNRNPPRDREDRNISQKIDHLIALCLENKTTISEIQRESVTTRKDILSLSSEVASVKAQLEKHSEGTKTADVKQKRIPTEISVCLQLYS